MMKLQDYANARNNVVLWWSSVGTPMGEYVCIGDPDCDFAERRGWLDLPGVIDDADCWDWTGEGNPTDHNLNSVTRLIASVDADKWNALAEDEVEDSETLLAQWEACVYNPLDNNNPTLIHVTRHPNLIEVSDGQHTWLCLEAEYDEAIELAAVLPPAADGDAYTAICRLIDTVCQDGDYSGPQTDELKAAIEAAGLEIAP